MKPIEVGLGLGTAETVAKDQPQYRPLAAELVEHPDGRGLVVLTRWTFDAEERRRITNGEDLYLSIRTFGRPLQPLLASVGPEIQREFLAQPQAEASPRVVSGAEVYEDEEDDVNPAR